MISFIRGTLIEKFPTFAVIEVNGVGFQVFIPVSTFEQLVDIKNEQLLLSHLHVREDQLTLYGFATEEERLLFRDLLSVSGIGPKLALGILSGNSVAKIYQLVANADEAGLVRIKGLGKKTAQRLILDLQEKAAKRIEHTRDSMDDAKPVQSQYTEQAVLAMMSLGYSKTEAEKAATQAASKLGGEASLEALLRIALSGE